MPFGKKYMSWPHNVDLVLSSPHADRTRSELHVAGLSAALQLSGRRLPRARGVRTQISPSIQVYGNTTLFSNGGCVSLNTENGSRVVM